MPSTLHATTVRLLPAGRCLNFGERSTMLIKRCGWLLLILAGACRTSAPSADAAAVRQIIETNNANAARWYAAGQIDSIAQLFALDAWQFPPNSAPLAGRDSIASFWRTATTWGQWQFDLRAQDVVTNGPLAVERGQFTLKFAAGPSSPIPSAEDRGNYVVLWRREDDGAWRVVWDAPVSVVPLSPPAAK